MLYAKPSDWEREQAREGAVYSEAWWKLAGMMGRPEFYSGADAYFMEKDPSGGWRYDRRSDTYYNVFAWGSKISANDFSQYVAPAFGELLYYNDGEQLYIASSLLDIGIQSSSTQELMNSALQFMAYHYGLMADGGDDPASDDRSKVSLFRIMADYTICFPYDFYGAALDFTKNYIDMRKLNIKNSDKYFHSKANFQATQRGPGGAFFAIHFSNLREIFAQRIKGDTRFDAIQDQEANIYGRIQGWEYRYYKGDISFEEVIPFYRKDYFPDGY